MPVDVVVQFSQRDGVEDPEADRRDSPSFGRRRYDAQRHRRQAGPRSRWPSCSFSHLEVVFRFHLTDPADLHYGARAARDNPAWPKVGIFGHRNMRRLNWLGVSRCRLLAVDGLDLHVEDLDAVDGTPVLDVKPWFAEFGPRGEVRQAPWSTEMLGDYFAPSPTA
ncbi:TrmO family methyltransferase domain-containing protein [Pilimelia anulata]|uniref:TrmO family methyltransferase domain-containing protein n=1 Tax=Pilimelia anulata TaxID=53371 RepID=UPI00166A9977